MSVRLGREGRGRGGTFERMVVVYRRLLLRICLDYTGTSTGLPWSKHIVSWRTKNAGGAVGGGGHSIEPRWGRGLLMCYFMLYLYRSYTIL